MSGEKPSPANLERGAFVGPCEILGRVGDGGFGYIFKVRRDGRVYALKVARQRHADLPPDERAQAEERLHREVAALMSLHHPNIVRVHSFDRWPDIESGYPYLVMDFVEGSCLYEWRAETRPTLPRSVVFEKLAAAVGYMHRLGICHWT
jgi:serine/threonine-protein kinase